MKKSLLLCWQAGIKNYDKALRQKVETEMSYSTNNPASNETSKVLLEFKIKIKGLLPGGYQTSPCVSLTAEMLLTVTNTYLLPVVSTIRNPNFYYFPSPHPSVKAGFSFFCPFLAKVRSSQRKARRSAARQAPKPSPNRANVNGKKKQAATQANTYGEPVSPRGRRSPGKR